MENKKTRGRPRKVVVQQPLSEYKQQVQEIIKRTRIDLDTVAMNVYADLFEVLEYIGKLDGKTKSEMIQETMDAFRAELVTEQVFENIKRGRGRPRKVK